MASEGAPRRSHAFVDVNNMVTPYTNRLFACLRARGNDLAVVSCSHREANRAWGDVTPTYRHEVLRGIVLPVGPRRFAHVNLGVGPALDRLAPAALVITGLYPTMVLAAWWARRRGVPLALRIDGGAADMPTSPYHRLVRRMILRQARAVMVCGRKGRDYFAGQGVDPARIVDMPLVPAWSPPPVLPPFADRPFDVLWAAELDDTVKNLSFFRDVVLALKRARPQLRVRILGRGKDAGLLAPLRAAGIDCLHEERRDWDAMPEVFLSSRLLLLPSRREPWGLVCNEAMQCGTVCLVSPKVGAADDLVTADNGIVAPLEVDRWRDAALALLDDQPRWQALSAAAAIAAGGRTIDSAAAAYEGMLRSLVAAPSREVVAR